MASILLFPITILLLFHSQSNAQLQVGFYSDSCPDAESIVASAVHSAVAADPTAAAALLRIQFHDCFVNGCDGSILIQKSDNSQENKAFGHQGLRGFDVVDKAKAELEKKCPGVVSCADIVALMARDSIVLSNGPNYDVPTGRRDGRVSNLHDADDMPDVQDSVETLKDKFANKGLSERDLVVLNAAHTVGTTACFFLYDRLYGSGGPDKTMSQELHKNLTTTCPEGGENTVRCSLDWGSPTTFDTQFFRNLRNGFGVLKSDAAMYQASSTKGIVDSYLSFGAGLLSPSFQSDFVDAIVRMGMIGVITGDGGEIRERCSSFN